MPIDTVATTDTINDHKDITNLLVAQANALGTASAVTITGGTINGAVIGGGTPAAGTFTNVVVNTLLNVSAATVTFADGQINGSKLTNGTVVVDKLATNSVSTIKILDSNITEAKIAAGAVTETKIGAGAVTADKIGTGAVVEAKIGTGAVTADKIGSSAVTETKIDTGAVTVNKIGTGAVTESKIGTGAVTADKIGSSAVTNTKIADSAVTLQKIQDNAVTTVKIADLNVTEGKIAAGAVTVNKLGNDAVETAKIKDANVTEAKLASAVTAKLGGKVLLATYTTAGSQANIDITSVITSTYDDYEIVLSQIQCATDGSKLQMRTSSDNGSTFDSTAGHYLWTYTAIGTTIAGDNISNSDTEIELTQTSANGAGRTISGEIKLFGVNTVTSRKNMTLSLTFSQTTGNIGFYVGGAIRNDTSNALNAVRLFWSSGNFTNGGVVRVYGIRKS